MTNLTPARSICLVSTQDGPTLAVHAEGDQVILSAGSKSFVLTPAEANTLAAYLCRARDHALGRRQYEAGKATA
ncbi:MAG TPA: hypothetical protein VIX86_05505 [Streptosporangiaceae bacterium]